MRAEDCDVSVLATVMRNSMMAVACEGEILAGRYRLDWPVGSGGAGRVWRAVDLVLERPVAVKLRRPEAADDPDVKARFLAEARIASGLSHPGVAQVHDYGEYGEGNQPFLVMELVEGPSLADVLAAGPLDPARTMDVVAQVAAALQAAHSAGMVHRDIKPANLLINRDGRVKITDFGIASPTGGAQLPSTGVIVGTPAYLAPERAAGASATPASDLYSLGVVGYECLTGAPPFRGAADEVAEAHVRRAFPPLSIDVPAGIRALVTALTEKDPARRPSSAGEVCGRASSLHAEHADEVSRPPGNWPAIPLPWPALARAPTLLDTRSVAGQGDDQPPARERLSARPGRWRTIGSGMLAAAALIAVGLGGWEAGLIAAASPRAPIVPTASEPHAARGVVINGADFHGWPVRQALARLRRLGLRPSVIWLPAPAGLPATVLSVLPVGRVPVGSEVTVTAARPALFGDQNGDGHDRGGHDNGGGTDGGRH